MGHLKGATGRAAGHHGPCLAEMACRNQRAEGQVSWEEAAGEGLEHQESGQGASSPARSLPSTCPAPSGQSHSRG